MLILIRLVVVVVVPDPFRGMGAFQRNPTVGPRPKVWIKGQKWKY